MLIKLIRPGGVKADNDPLFEFHQWQINLRILEFCEIKTIPNLPISHPFIEKLIGSIQREFLDHMMFLMNMTQTGNSESF